MTQRVLRVEGLPASALDAAAQFHARDLPAARAVLRDADDLAMIFPPAPYDHRAWRLAAVQDLAREAAPRRVNAIAGAEEAAIAETLAWLEQASGVTGPLLAVDQT